MPNREFLRVANDIPRSSPDCSEIVSALSCKRGKFFLCIGGTETSDAPGISAAGVTPQLRRLTPCTDAEALLAGAAITGDSIPISPLGIVSPIVITRACLGLIDIDIEVIDCGSFFSPLVPHRKVGENPARALWTGAALSSREVGSLYEAGRATGAAAARSFDFVVAAECVPGGTTTAMGLLTALGFSVSEMLSSSLPQTTHDNRFELVRQGLARSGVTAQQFLEEPLLAVAAVGDPVQPFVAGIAAAASQCVPLILGGGSQMLAIYALWQALLRSQAMSLERKPLVITTKWVAYDPRAQTVALSRKLGAPFLVSCPDFHKSVHGGLRAYEDGNVKEGTGAGAALALAYSVGGCSEPEIMGAIDRTYSELVDSQSLSPCI